MIAREVPVALGERGRVVFRLTRARGVLLALTGIGLGAAAYRMVFGLGAATNLSDRWPWGLWVWWDVMTGVALAGGGYSTALMVNFLGKDRWRSVEHGAMLTSLVGYVLVLGGLFLDLGRWFNAWRPLVFWGYHSVMFELFWCVVGYTLVQIVEFMPIFLRRFHIRRLAGLVAKIFVPVMILGIVLPSCHQSALGSLYVIAKGRLDPLWWSMLLPLFFLMSSFFVGPATVTLENVLSARVNGGRPPVRVLNAMLRLSAKLLLVYLALKVGDLAVRSVLPRLFDGSVGSWLFLAELVGGVALPAWLLLGRGTSARRMVTASVLMVLGVVVNRANIVFTGMAAAAGGASYVPSPIEVAVTVGLVAAGLLVYLFIVDNFPVLPGHEESS